jgi:hypothetical protein
VDGKNTSLLDVSTDGGTNGDGTESGFSKNTNLNEATDVRTVAPAEDGGLQSSLERTVRGVQPSNQGSLDINIQAGNNTASSADAETSLNVGSKVNINIKESRQRSLSGGAQNESRGKLGGREDTIDGNIDRLLGSDVGTSRDID